MDQAATSLWSNPEFIKLWVGQTISVFGSEITNLALPLTAVLILHATPSQMGILGALGTLPFLLIGLFAGGMGRPDVATPHFDGRRFWAGTAGWLPEYRVHVCCTVSDRHYDRIFRCVVPGILPSLVGREHLVEGNSKLEVTNSAAQILGPGLAGQLVQAFTAPVAIIVDAVSFLFSAISLWMIRNTEEIIHTDEQPARV